MFVVRHGEFPQLKTWQLRVYIIDTKIKHTHKIILCLLVVVIP